MINIMTAPLAIIPKYLWTDIIGYLSLKNTILLSQIHHQFDSIIDWKICFEKRLDGIVMVSGTRLDKVFGTVTSNANYNWKYACVTYTKCDNINGMFSKLQALPELKLDEVSYCQVFIKGGSYEYIVSYGDVFDMDGNDRCTQMNNGYMIELIGNNNDNHRTSIYTSNISEHIATSIRINVSVTFSIIHIDFVNVYCDFINKNNVVNSVLIHDCSFIYNQDLVTCVGLQLKSIQNITITKCIFDLVKSALNVGIIVLPCGNNLNLKIADCQFDNKTACYIVENNVKICKVHIDFLRNTVRNADNLFVTDYDLTDYINLSENDYDNKITVCHNVRSTAHEN